MVAIPAGAIFSPFASAVTNSKLRRKTPWEAHLSWPTGERKKRETAHCVEVTRKAV
jgi:hypothetical protein